ncbi:DoxX family protein [Fibrisoma montanum]|uniref:DoxX family protein n=1 Tax=Fibrisoma montanum TaxID=2305895 RepID=A0A418M2M9_9BACT|nr:DoxX family protein [Fibrisoma montanum]RIV19993.1 DoxX family protein [Fibrisoma montanum]
MPISSTLDRLHAQARQNRWLWLFSIFNRLALAAGFIPAGIVKLMDERFASGLSANHPMGSYLVALHHTGYYYTFIGVVQVLAAILLLIPRTVTLGAFLYFPIILNICMLTYAVRFDGSLFTAPLMTLATLYLICWNYEKWKYILPFNRLPASVTATGNTRMSNKFPTLFFTGVFAAVVICVVGIPSLYSIKPRNTLPQCIRQFKNTNRTVAGENFCNCIHKTGTPLNQCMTDYYNSPDDPVRVP